MLENEYISISEFCKLNNKTEQGVYKRIRNKDDIINNYTRYNDTTGNLEISKKASEIYKKNITKQTKLNQEGKKFSNEKGNQEKADNDNKDLIIAMLREEVAELHKRLAEANELIENQQKITMLKIFQN